VAVEPKGKLLWPDCKVDPFCILARPGNLLFNARQGIAGYFSGQTTYAIHDAVRQERLTLWFDGHQGRSYEEKNWPYGNRSGRSKVCRKAFSIQFDCFMIKGVTCPSTVTRAVPPKRRTRADGRKNLRKKCVGFGVVAAICM
jgi:hypothetical protein